MILFLVGCVDPDEKDGDETSEVVTVDTFAAKSDRDGYLRIPVEVTAGVDVFQVVVKRDSGTAALEYLYAPDGELVLDWEDWYDSSFSLTEAFFPTEFASTTNWPVRAGDGPLTEGTWEVVVGTYDMRGYYSGGEDVTIEVLTRADPAFERGALRAVIAYAEGVREEDGVEDAVEAAVDYWVELYAEFGVVLEPEFTDIAVDPSLPDTYEGLEEIRRFHEDRDERSVLMIVGEDIAGDEFLYGEAGGIPGPYAAADHAAVEVSWLANAGPDGEFQEADILLFGETMAHEVGHYLGLFHPVEDGFEYWDALEDTADCTGYSRCESELGSNLMFPYPVCGGISTSSCLRQDEVTTGQAGVVQRWVGVE
ncbi:MAG: hypothetical protein ACK4YP_07115 [Myxococcota bacterium]